MKRKRLQLKLDRIGENDEDMLQFKDSERESIMGYLEGNNVRQRIDTPTRILNNSN